MNVFPVFNGLRFLFFILSGHAFEDGGKRVLWSVRSEEYYKNRIINEEVWKQYNVTIQEVEVKISFNRSYY